MQKIDVPLTFAVSAAVLIFFGEIVVPTLNASWVISAAFWTAVFTGALTVSTIALWWQTKKSSRVAERALTDLERPYIFILDFNWITKGGPKEQVGFTYTVANGGKLPAIIKRVRFGMAWNATDPTPDLEQQPPIHDLLRAPLIGGSDERHVRQDFYYDEARSETKDVQLGSGEMASVPMVAILAQMLAKITIEYDGPITKGHETTTCWEWQTGKGAFSPYGGEAHNRRT